MAFEMKGEIPYGEVQQTVSDALGKHYKVTRKSDSVIFPLVTENIHIKWHGDTTILQPAPGGVWIIQGFNAISIHRRVRHSLTRALVDSR